MPFESGHPKLGGRKAGTPNKKADLLTGLLEHFDINPIKIIAENLPRLEPQKQVEVSLSLMSYIFPKRKALELENYTHDEFEDLEEQKNLAREELERLKSELRDGLK